MLRNQLIFISFIIAFFSLVVAIRFAIILTTPINRLRDAMIVIGQGNVLDRKIKKLSNDEVGEMIVCRKFLKVKKSKLHVNFEYEIDQINGDEITIFDGLETFVTLDRDLLKK